MKFYDTLPGILPERAFIIRSSDLDTFKTVLNSYKQLLAKVQRATFSIQEQTAGEINFKLIPVGAALGDRYNISAESNVGGRRTTLRLSTATLSNKNNIHYINRLLSYLNGKSFPYSNHKN